MPNRAPRHQPYPPQRRDPQAERQRQQQEHVRLYHTKRWERFRAARLMQDPVCQDCLQAPSEHVHHTTKVRDEPNNLCSYEHTLALCESCHSRRTPRVE
jgi:5-methylcytosine-specific restriction protein A